MEISVSYVLFGLMATLVLAPPIPPRECSFHANGCSPIGRMGVKGGRLAMTAEVMEFLKRNATLTTGTTQNNISSDGIDQARTRRQEQQQPEQEASQQHQRGNHSADLRFPLDGFDCRAPTRIWDQVYDVPENCALHARINKSEEANF